MTSDASLIHSQSADEPAPPLPHRPVRIAAPARIAAMPREARPYQGHRAGIVSRMLASAVDLVVVMAVLAAGYGGWSLILFLWRPSRFHFPVVPSGWILFAAAAVLLIYLSAAWGTTGRTWGDLLFGLRVVNHRGGRLRSVGTVLRAALCVVFPIGILLVAVNRTNRSVADVVLRTSVIYDWSWESARFTPALISAPTPASGDGPITRRGHRAYDRG